MKVRLLANVQYCESKGQIQVKYQLLNYDHQYHSPAEEYVGFNAMYTMTSLLFSESHFLRLIFKMNKLNITYVKKARA